MTRQVRALIVDHVPDDASSMVESLKRHGFDIHHERVDGVEALERALSPGDFDLLICKSSIPGMDSFMVSEIMWKCGKSIPLVVVPGDRLWEGRQDPESWGAREAFERLARAIDKALEKGQLDAPRSMGQKHPLLAHEEWRRTFDAISDTLMVLDMDYRIEKVNAAMAEKLGMEESSLKGEKCFRLVHDLDAPPPFCPHTRSMSDGRPHFAEINEERLGGDFFVSVSPLRSDSGELFGCVHYARDISEQKNAERALRESEEKLRLLAETAADAITMIDSCGDITYWNPAAERMFGYSSSEAMGMSLHLMLAPQRYHDLYRSGFARYRETGTGPTVGKIIEVEAVRKDGAEIPVEVSFAVTRLNEERYAIGIIRDISERRRAEEERKKLEEQLRQAQKMEAVGQLAGGIAHDFNNILTVIVGFGNLIKFKLDADNPAQSDLEQILAASDKAAQLTQQLLAYSRKQVLSPKPVDMNEIVRNCGKFLKRIIGDDVTLSMEIADKPLTIFADGILIEQVLMNLVANARDAMPCGGTLSIATGLFDMDDSFIKSHRFGSTGCYAMLAVGDTGEGMDEATSSRVFEPFFTTKEVGKGTGLGLSVVYGAVKQHDGYIDCVSRRGVGTTFSLYFPVICADKTDMTENSGVDQQKVVETILVADDDEQSRWVSRLYLENFGYRVVEAADGEEALNTFAAHREEIDLTLLDVIMPGLNGREVYKQIKELKPDVKVIFMSGYTSDILRMEEMVEDGLTVLQKPTMFKELLTTIRDVMGREG